MSDSTVDSRLICPVSLAPTVMQQPFLLSTNAQWAGRMTSTFKITVRLSPVGIVKIRKGFKGQELQI